MKKLFFLLFFAFFLKATGQNDSITYLDEVVLSDIKLHENSDGFKVLKISDSTISRNGKSLTDLLRFNSNIYFKENGNGMVSSVAFRGTGAAQTAVIWNGININSSINGQTDFNTIYTAGYDNILVRSGGGSVLYGSGAIGGSVHLNNSFRFTKHFDKEFKTAYGSYNSLENHLGFSYGTTELNLKVDAGFVKSDNDYPYLGTSRKNVNGEYENLNLNLNFGIFLNSKNVLKFYHNTFLGDRNFSGGLFFEGNDKYIAENSRSLLEWQQKGENYRSTFRFAQVFEYYQFFLDKNSSDFSFGKTNEWIGQYNFRYSFSSAIKIDAQLEYSSTNGTGSNVDSVERNVLSGVLLYSHTLGEKFKYGLQLRKEFANDYESPLLFAFDTNFSVSENYNLKFNLSRNFRMPSFNDLYWETGGNNDLKPETSWQAEIGQEYKFNSFLLSLNGFLIKSTDLIKWIPNGNMWFPENVSEVNVYGFETGINYESKVAGGNFLASGNYSYTISKNGITDRFLMYVPKNKFTGSLAYSYQNISVFYQSLFTDQVFTTTDESAVLEGYSISNIGVSFKFLKQKKINFEVLFKLNNIYNQKYQVTAGRPMPPRNFETQLTLNF